MEEGQTAFSWWTMTDRPLFKNVAPPLAKPAPEASKQPYSDLNAKLLEETPEQLQAKIDALEKEIELAEGLPFLHGWSWYSWARAFYESTNHVNLLCAANQISKSSTQIRKCINWATDKDLWPSLWKSKRPRQFWYLYPSKEIVNIEFLTKWQEFLPQGKYKEDPKYGWREMKKGGDTIGIAFNSGVFVFFRTYMQNATVLQSGTCDAIFCDEELPVELFDELMFRLSASDGYFHMVFTATLGQEFWRLAMEPEEDEKKNGKENLVSAFKQTVSLYDAMFYEDGTPSHWTAEKIALVRGRCSTHLEVLKRVYGKFVVLGGRKYEQFDIKKHLKPKHAIPSSWLLFGGADCGGGGKSHKGALCYVGVSPDYRQGRVFLGWRGEGETTTAGDIVEKHMGLVKDNKLKEFVGLRYDWASKDFKTISDRNGLSFQPADKSHDLGEDVLNTLFKNDMLLIYEDEETAKLASELATLKKSTPKNKAIDDFADALRYCVTSIPWDWTCIVGAPPDQGDEKPEEPKSEMQRQIDERRKEFDDAQEAEKQRIEDEFAEWNDAYGD